MKVEECFVRMRFGAAAKDSLLGGVTCRKRLRDPAANRVGTRGWGGSELLAIPSRSTPKTK